MKRAVLFRVRPLHRVPDGLRILFKAMPPAEPNPHASFKYRLDHTKFPLDDGPGPSAWDRERARVRSMSGPEFMRQAYGAYF